MINEVLSRVVQGHGVFLKLDEPVDEMRMFNNTPLELMVVSKIDDKGRLIISIEEWGDK